MKFIASAIIFLSMIGCMESTKDESMPDCSQYIPTRFLNDIQYTAERTDNFKENKFCSEFGITPLEPLGRGDYYICVRLIQPYFEKYPQETLDEITLYAKSCIENGIDVVTCAKVMIQLQDLCWVMENATEYINMAAEYIRTIRDFTPDFSRQDYTHYHSLRVDTCIDMFQKTNSEDTRRVLNEYEYKHGKFRSLLGVGVNKDECTCAEIVILEAIAKKYSTPELRDLLWTKVCIHDMGSTWPRAALESILNSDTTVELVIQFLINDKLKMVMPNWMRNSSRANWSYTDIVRFAQQEDHSYFNPTKIDLVARSIENEITKEELSGLKKVLDEIADKETKQPINETARIKCLTEILEKMMTISNSTLELHFPKFWYRYSSVEGFITNFRLFLELFEESQLMSRKPVAVCRPEFFQFFQDGVGKMYLSPYHMSVIDDFLTHLLQKERVIMTEEFLSCLDYLQNYETTLYERMPSEFLSLYTWATTNPSRSEEMRQFMIGRLVSDAMTGLKCFKKLKPEELLPTLILISPESFP